VLKMVFRNQWKNRRFAIVVSLGLVLVTGLLFVGSYFFTDRSVDNQSKEATVVAIKSLDDIAKPHQSVPTNSQFIRSISIHSDTDLKQSKK